MTGLKQPSFNFWNSNGFSDDCIWNMKYTAVICIHLKFQKNQNFRNPGITSALWWNAFENSPRHQQLAIKSQHCVGYTPANNGNHEGGGEYLVNDMRKAEKLRWNPWNQAPREKSMVHDEIDCLLKWPETQFVIHTKSVTTLETHEASQFQCIFSPTIFSPRCF